MGAHQIVKLDYPNRKSEDEKSARKRLNMLALLRYIIRMKLKPILLAWLGNHVHNCPIKVIFNL